MTSHANVPSWNDARHLASQLRDALQTNAYDEVEADAHIELPTKGAARKCLEATENASEAVNELAREIISVNRETSPDAPSDGNPLNQWNDARRLATKLLDASDGGSYAEVADAYNQIEFPSEEHISEKVTRLTGARTEQINELARWILEWDTKTWDDTPTTPSTEVVEAQNQDTTALSQWNEARHLATDLLDAVEQESNYREIADDYNGVEFPPRKRAREKASELTGSRTERINGLARWILTWDECDWEGVTLHYETSNATGDEETIDNDDDEQSVEDTESVPLDDLSPLEQAAADILENFRNHEGRYGKIIQEYSEFNLPPQPEMMMAVRRVQRKDDADAIAELTDEIEEWETAGAATDGSPRSQYVYGSSSQRL